MLKDFTISIEQDGDSWKVQPGDIPVISVKEVSPVHNVTECVEAEIRSLTFPAGFKRENLVSQSSDRVPHQGVICIKIILVLLLVHFLLIFLRAS